MSKKVKRSISMLLAILMIAAMSCIAATSAGALTAGTQIFFDNSQTQWEHVYIYGWQYGLSSDFVELEPIAEDSDIYAYTLTYDTVDNSAFCLFTNTTNWSGRQTVDIATSGTNNLWTPTTPIPESGSISGTWSYMTPPAAQPSVTATPGKNFAIEMSVTVNEFNCPGGARYTVNGGTATTFDGSATFTVGGADEEIGTQYTVVVTGLDDMGYQDSSLFCSYHCFLFCQVSQALKAASFAVEPKKVMTQSSTTIMTAAAETALAAGNSFAAFSTVTSPKAAVEAPQRM